MDYALDAGSPAEYMLETKGLVNSVIPDVKEGSRFMSCDLKYFLLYVPPWTHHNTCKYHTSTF